MPLTDMAVVTVEVLDVNDNAPRITNVNLVGSAPFFTMINEDPFHPDTPVSAPPPPPHILLQLLLQLLCQHNNYI